MCIATRHSLMIYSLAFFAFLRSIWYWSVSMWSRWSRWTTGLMLYDSTSLASSPFPALTPEPCWLPHNIFHVSLWLAVLVIWLVGVCYTHIHHFLIFFAGYCYKKQADDISGPVRKTWVEVMVEQDCTLLYCLWFLPPDKAITCIKAMVLLNDPPPIELQMSCVALKLFS